MRLILCLLAAALTAPSQDVVLGGRGRASSHVVVGVVNTVFERPEQYPGWKFNNIQPVTRPDGSIAEGMLLFYGWNDENAPTAKAFLLHETPGMLCPDCFALVERP